MINNSNRWSVAILIKFSITFKTISCSVLTENNDVINCFKIYLLFKIWNWKLKIREESTKNNKLFISLINALTV